MNILINLAVHIARNFGLIIIDRLMNLYIYILEDRLDKQWSCIVLEGLEGLY